MQLGLTTALYTLVVLIALQVWVEPRLFRRKWNNPVLTLVILLAMGDAFGLLGIILAPPLSAVCQILWGLLVSHRLTSGAATQISDLRERQARVWATIRAMDEPHLPLMTSSMERLTRLMVKAEPILQVENPLHSVSSLRERAARPAEPSERLLHIAPQAEQEETNGRTQNG